MQYPSVKIEYHPPLFLVTYLLTNIMSTDTVSTVPVVSTMKYAKSMTGHVYSYPVHTAGEFKKCIFDTYRIPPRYLHLLEPEEIQEIDEKEETVRTVNKYDEEPLLAEVVYYLMCDTLPTQHLLDWIHPSDINLFLQKENPAYRITAEEAENYTPDELNYLAFYPERIHVIEEYLHRLTDRGWRRLFGNSGAGPLLERVYERTRHEFVIHGHMLAINTETVPLVARLLREGVIPRSTKDFWRNLNHNENAVSLLVEHYPEHIELSTFSANPMAGPYLLEQLERCGEEYAQHLHWRKVSATQDYRLFLSRFPEHIDVIGIQHNPDPAVIEWLRVHVKPEDMKWNILAKQTDPAFVAFLEENLDHLTDEAWNSLSYNPHAVPLLKRHPERIHWTLLCCNPSEEVIPMIEKYLTHLLEVSNSDPSSSTTSADKPVLQCTEREHNVLLHRYYEQFEHNSVAYDILSNEQLSFIGTSFVHHRILHSYQGKTVMDESYRTILNRGAISFHPHALPLLQKYPILIYPNAFSLRNDIYVELTPCMLD